MRALVLCVSRSHRHTSVLLSSDSALRVELEAGQHPAEHSDVTG